jgi:predicted phage baseplate assembly protein
MTYFCCDERRLQVVKTEGTLNGVEYVEVIDRDAPSQALRQRTLVVRFLRPTSGLTADNFRIEGGERIRDVGLEWVARADALPAGESPTLVDGLIPSDQFFIIRTTAYGDFSSYTLAVVAGPSDGEPPSGFDPLLTRVTFSFKVECESDFDCAAADECGPPASSPPVINYLAKDYATFRRLMLDRLSTVTPAWRERIPADVGVAVVELLAYAADQLSYQQDAIATEAYIGTARRRASLRRHARLMDYAVHEGANARVWVRVTVADEVVPLPRRTQLLTRVERIPARVVHGDIDYREALTRGAQVFETCDDTVLYASHDRFEFYTWGNRRCCLPAGATTATLAGRVTTLKAGDVLLFIEDVGPRTGLPEDADRAHRCAVRLTHVRPSEDPSGGLFADPPTAAAVAVTEIEWAGEDALPFAVCVSAETDQEHGAVQLESVSTAYGNVVLADHGLTIAGEPLGLVPPPRVISVRRQTNPCGARAYGLSTSFAMSDRSGHEPAQSVPPRFRPRLRHRPITFSDIEPPTPLFATEATSTLRADLTARDFSPAVQTWLRAHAVIFTAGPVIVQGGDGVWSIADGAQSFVVRDAANRLSVYTPGASASSLMQSVAARAGAAVTLDSELAGRQDHWMAVPDLLASDGEAREFVVEPDHDGTAVLRFGDDVHGRRPQTDTFFAATYRVGNGVAGNIGAESLAHIVSTDARLAGVTNPIAARGGIEPEGAEGIRRDAPEAFRIQERAVTPEDYGAVTERHASVQRAAATFRWTGSWHTVFLTVDRRGGGEVDAVYEGEIRRHVERYRMAGYDLEVDGPRFVPLEVGMRVCVQSDYFRADVRAALLRVFSSGLLPDGRPALFHPDNFTFGQRVYLSQIYAAAQAVEGVASVAVDTFQRLRQPDTRPLDDGFVEIGRLEIAQLANDPTFPERGLLHLSVGGGK